jgi:nicotinate-nucleotide adenylyltransferase
MSCAGNTQCVFFCNLRGEHMQTIGILGGSFNPLHIAHLRLALEVREQLGLNQIDLVPAAIPPHKHTRNLLPFSVRFNLLRDAVQDLVWMRVNDLEARRQGPSYTYDTLRAYRLANPENRLFFIMGSEDLVLLPSWYKAACLPQWAHLVIVCRGGLGRQGADELIRKLWPASRMTSQGWHLAEGHLPIFFLEMNRLDISSSLIRDKWRKGQSIRYLVPDSVEHYVQEHREEVARVWGEGTSPGGNSPQDVDAV